MARDDLGKPMPPRLQLLVEDEVEAYWRRGSSGSFPPKASWERDPLTTPRARAARDAVLAALPWSHMRLRERYAAYRSATLSCRDII